MRQKLIDDLAALKSHVNKKYTEDKEAGKIKDNWLEKTLKSYDPEAKDKALRRNCHPLMNSMTSSCLSVILEKVESVTMRCFAV